MESEALIAAGEPPLSSCVKHREGQHFVVLDSGGQPQYVSLPQDYAASAENAVLCFTDHKPKDVTNDMCCPQESGHVHAHVHHGEIIENILLEQCMEESGCALPVLRELSGLCQNMLPLVDVDHEHKEGCGHFQIRHGEHIDWLVPLKDGSFLLSHPQVQNGHSSFIEHGRLINRGKTLAKLQLRPKLVDLFSYESPKQKGYESLSQFDEDAHALKRDSFQVVKGQLDEDYTLMPSASMGRNVVHGGMTKVDIPATFVGALIKTKLDVMGICCPSEVPLIKKLLDPLPGVEEVSVNATTKTVLVLHDQLLVTDVQLVKILNGAHLNASIHQRGELKTDRNWPSPWCVGSGILVAIAFFHYLYKPMQWVALGAVAIGVPPLILKAISALRKFVLDINILMLIAVSGAIALGDYLEAGTIVFLFTLAEWLESRSTVKARSAIAAVVDRAPLSATLLDGGTLVRVEEVKVGTLLSVKTGETIPIDGEVVSGRGFVDESSLTGESIPVEKELGATVWAGTINVSGYVTMKTTALSVDSAVARMVRLVEETQNQRSRTEMLVEKIAKYYTPAVVIAAVVIGLAPWASGVHNPRHYVYLALVLLVVACPCALVISTPVVVTCGIAQAARMGLLVKGGTYLEILGRLKVVALDKTGTLSEGQFCVSNLLPVDGISTLQQVLYWVTSVENKASHPLAAALVNYARLKGVEPSEDVTDFEVIAGEGVSAIVDGHTIQIGNARMAARFGWDTAAALEILANWSSSGATVGWIGVDGIAIGIFSVGDQLRPEAAEAVRELKKLGIRVAMLTGDSTAAAANVHNKLGEIDVFAELLPEDKVRIVLELKEHGVIAMVGDGINDAPALAAADVGIAMGVAGSAIAMETADVALMTNDLRRLAAAVRLGLNCRWKIGQNITFSFVTKLLIIGLAAGGYASLWAAVVADVGTCLLVIFNSMRLLKEAKHHAGQDQCISEKLALELNCNSSCCDNSSCCEKGEMHIECSETKSIICTNVQAPGIAHKHRARLPWSHKHHDEKKVKREEDDLCCADKEDQPPCCSSARCEKKVLTSRGKGQRHGNNLGGFDKTKGVGMGSELCESQCCSAVSSAAIAQPKPLDCKLVRKCCLPEEKNVQIVEPMQKPRNSGISARCCSKETCNSLAPRVSDNAIPREENFGENCKDTPLTMIGTRVNPGHSSGVKKELTAECCANGSCKASRMKKISPAIEMSKDFDTSASNATSAVKTGTGCCANGSCKASANKKPPSPAVESSEVSELNASNAAGAVKTGTGCCANGSCKASANKKPPSPAVESSEVSELNASNAAGAVKTGTGCCANGSCKASANKKPPSPAVESSEVSELNASNAAGAVKTGTGCCANGSCKASANKKPPSPAVESSEVSELNASNAAGAVKTGTGCCANGSCKASANKKPPSPAVESSEVSELNASNAAGAVKTGTGCCANGSCKASANKKPPSPAVESSEVSELNASNAISAGKTGTGCCANGSCKASANKKTLTPAVETSEVSDSIASNGDHVKPAVGSCAMNGCKSALCDAKTTPANLAAIDLSATNDHLSKAFTNSTDSCCADPSSCKSCVA